MLRIDGVAGHARPMQYAQDSEEPEKRRSDAGKAYAIEGSQRNRLQFAPTTEACGRDEESGDGEENRDPIRPVPHDGLQDLPREMMAQRALLQSKTDVDVEQDDGQNRKPAQDVDSIDAGWHFLNVGESFRLSRQRNNLFLQTVDLTFFL